jgi:Fe2+ transport system protein FeoA
MPNTSPLATHKESVLVHVKNIQSDCKTQVKLLGLGIGIGSSLEVLRNRGGDMVLANNNIRISLGRSIAEKIFVSAEAI